MRRLLVGIVVGVLTMIGVASIAAAQDDTATTSSVAPVDVLQVSGLFDDIIVAEIYAAIDRAVEDQSQALVLQVDSQGAVVDDDVIEELMVAVDSAPVPVGIWIGPTGSRFTGSPAQLLAVADITGMAPGATVGEIGRAVSDFDLGPGLSELTNTTVGLSEARALNVFQQRISDEGIATMPNMIDALDGYEENGVTLDTTEEVTTEDGTVQRETVATPRFFRLGLSDQLFHTVASPEIAYLLLLIGISLVIFEYYSAGVGIAAVVGVVCSVLAFSGLGALPTSTWAVVLILLAMVAFAVDVQVGIPRFWTGVGLIFVIVASFNLFGSVGGDSLRPSWISLVVGIGGMALTYLLGMPLMVRTRFGTTLIERDDFVGAQGVAVGEIGADGVIRLERGDWKATAVSDEPITDGTPLRVTAVNGAILQVESVT